MKLTLAKKVWLITAAGLVLAGAILMLVSLGMIGGDFSRLSTVTTETNTYEITEPVCGVSINTSAAEDVTILPAKDGQCKVICKEVSNLTHAISVVEGVLTIQLEDNRAWYEYVEIGYSDTDLTVYLPAGDYESLTIRAGTGDVSVAADFTFGSLSITTSTGDIQNQASATGNMHIKAGTGDILVDNVRAGSVKLSVSSGDVTARGVVCAGEMSVTVSSGETALSDVACRSLSTTGNTGDLTMKNVIAAESFSVKRSTGTVKMDACDAAEIRIRTDTGSVKGTLLSDKVFLVTTDTGDIDVPTSVTGGRCEITTSTGDVRLSVVAS